MMTSCCLPSVIETRRPWWQRLAIAYGATGALRLMWVPSAASHPRDQRKPEPLRELDLWPLAGLSDAMQADIGLPDSMRARSTALKAREALWQRW